MTITVSRQTWRNDIPPWLAALTEDPVDCYGQSPEEALGKLVLHLHDLYRGSAMPYIKKITVMAHEVF